MSVHFGHRALQRVSEREAGLAPLLAVIDHLPKLRVVLLQGRDAEWSWRILARRHPEVNAGGRFVVVSTYHPSPQALRTPDASVRAGRIQHRVDAYRQVADALERKPATA